MLWAGCECLASGTLDSGFSHQSHKGAALRELVSQTLRQVAKNASLLAC
jgi:hypothetical protein